MTNAFKSHKPLPPKQGRSALDSVANRPRLRKMTLQDLTKAQEDILAREKALTEGLHPPKETGGSKEIGGPEGPEPTRYGDWERKGICVDF